MIIALHVVSHDLTGRRFRRTFLIRNERGEVDIVEDGAPRCGAADWIAIGHDLVLEVEAVEVEPGPHAHP